MSVCLETFLCRSPRRMEQVSCYSQLRIIGVNRGYVRTGNCTLVDFMLIECHAVQIHNTYCSYSWSFGIPKFLSGIAKEDVGILQPTSSSVLFIDPKVSHHRENTDWSPPTHIYICRDIVTLYCYHSGELVRVVSPSIWRYYLPLPPFLSATQNNREGSCLMECLLYWCQYMPEISSAVYHLAIMKRRSL